MLINLKKGELRVSIDVAKILHCQCWDADLFYGYKHACILYNNGHVGSTELVGFNLVLLVIDCLA